MINYSDSHCFQVEHVRAYNWGAIIYGFNLKAGRSARFRKTFSGSQAREVIHKIANELDDKQPKEKYVRIGVNEKDEAEWNYED